MSNSRSDGSSLRSVLRFEVAIERKADEVFNYLTDPSNVPRWSALVTNVENAPRGSEVGKGTQVRAYLSVFGFSLPLNVEFIEFDRKSRQAILKTQLPKEGAVETHFDVEDLGSVSVAHFEHQVTLPQWLLAKGLSLGSIARAVEGAAQHGLSNIRNILERNEELKIEQTESFAQTVLGPGTLHGLSFTTQS
jgi:Polyketide cyclase / dehydrase and lipid transport